MAISKAIQEMNEAFAGSFMQPQAYMDTEKRTYYCRLSADGYLDCTDWEGPFDSLDECAEHLVSVYGE